MIIANWKLNPLSEAEAVRLAKATDASNVVLCPPFPFLGAVRREVRKGALGAQDVFWESKGAYTGEVSGEMLRSLGAKYVIIGHSERRMHLGETDQMIHRKIRGALLAGLTVVLCVGEPGAVRKKGIGAAKAYVKKQLVGALAGIRSGSLIIAYEPIWAIGTGKADKPEDTAEMVRFIKSKARTKVLYGGSVKAENAKAFLSLREVDGALVGGASLKPAEFKAVIAAGK